MSLGLRLLSLQPPQSRKGMLDIMWLVIDIGPLKEELRTEREGGLSGKLAAIRK